MAAADSQTKEWLSRIPPLRGDQPVQLIILQSRNVEGLLQELDRLESRLNEGETLTTITDVSVKNPVSENENVILCLLAKDSTELLGEINHARRGFPRAAAAGVDWQTPAGSYFTPAPLGSQAGLAFVYPGAFSSYPGMGRDLFSLYPDVFNHLRTLTSDPWYTLRGYQIYPAGLDELTPAELSANEISLTSDPVAMLSSGTTLAIALTWVLREKMGLFPMSAFGYSLGESSMLFSLGVWQAGDQAMRVLDESPVFKLRLAGPRQAVQEFWSNNGNGQASWENHILMTNPDRVLPVLVNIPRVYMTHVNAPNQVVIGGEAAGCAQVINAIGCPSLRAPFDHVLHCPPVETEFSELHRMNEWPVSPSNGVKLFTADGYTQLPDTSQGIADSIARMLTQPLDFPHLVRKAYDVGARIFIEVGAGSNCTRWVDESLAGKPHLAVPANRRGIGDRAALLRLAARLASHQVPVNLNSLLIA